MRLSTEIALALLLGGCGAAATTAPSASASSVVSSTNGPAVEAPWTWPEIAPPEIVVLEVTPEGGETVRLERRDAGWRITSPIDAIADRHDVENLLDHLEYLGPPDPELRSAPPPRAEAISTPVRVVARSASETILDLEIGGCEDEMTQIRGRGRTVFEWAQGTWRYTVARELREWREQHLLAEHRSDMARVTWDVAGVHLELSVDARGDIVDASGTEPAYAPRVFQGLGRLHADDFADLSLSEAGIGPSSDRVVIAFEHEEPLTIFLGGPAGDDGSRYAAVDGEASVYVLSARSAAFVAMTADVLENGLAVDEEPLPPPGASDPSLDELPPEIRRALEEAMRASGGSN